MQEHRIIRLESECLRWEILVASPKSYITGYGLRVGAFWAPSFLTVKI